MSFVGTRPEAIKYVEKYKPEYMATLLLPAGITSEASIRYKDEAELLSNAMAKTIIIRRIKLCIRIHSFRINILCKIEKF